jgi:protein TonB
MLLRYTTAIGAGACVTAGLIFWMQLMIAGGDVDLPPRTTPPVWLTSRIDAPPPPREPREPPPPPEPLVAPPETTIVLTDPTTARVATDRPATPPGPPSPSGHMGGRQGPWINDSDHMLLARIEPTYPQRALIRGTEGSVVVEFTITKSGSVTDVRIVASTDPVFEPAAAAAIGKTRYRPRIVDGAPVETRGVTTEIEFRLEN